MDAESFENSVGSYTLIGIDAGRIRYRFTNRTGNTAVADVAAIIWGRMKSRGHASVHADPQHGEERRWQQVRP